MSHFRNVAVAFRADRFGLLIPPPTVMRWFVAIWLAAGGISKLYDGYSSAAPAVMGIQGRFMVLVLGAVELMIVMAQIVRIFPRVVHGTIVAMLAIFTIIHICVWMGLVGSCGCFGAISVSPFMMIVANGLLLLGYIATPPPIAAARSHFVWSMIIPGLVLGMVAIIYSHRVMLVPEDGQGVSRVIKDPAMDILKSIPELQSGRWNVVLYEPGCPRCAAELPRIMTMAQTSNPAKIRWCFINLDVGKPPHDDPVIDDLPPLSLQVSRPNDKIASPVTIVICDRVIVGHSLE